MLCRITTLTWSQVCSFNVKILMTYAILTMILTTTIEFKPIKPALLQCEMGWFGANCTYKCHCILDKCTPSGDCVTGISCITGYFGPACQYVDVLHTEGHYDNPVNLVDYDESTCMSENDKFVLLKLNERHPFYWLRITTKSVVTVNASSLKLQLKKNKICDSLTVTPATTRVWDLTCREIISVSELLLSGNAVGSLCSVFFSGGKNVALRQQTVQSSPSGLASVGSEKAVDGDKTNLVAGKSCIRTSGAGQVQSWIVFFDEPVVLLQIKLYSSIDFRHQLYLFNLTLLDEDQRQLEIFPAPDALKSTFSFYPTNYHIVSSLSVTLKGDIMTICEVETFGETWCSEKNRFGFDCDQLCWCSDNKLCHPTIGTCVPSCPTTKYGFGCTLSCSDACVDKNCSGNFGFCDSCEPGIFGQFCEKKCDSFHYGYNCSSECSKHCVPDTCNAVNGSCECHSGYRGETCHYCPKQLYGDDCSQACSLFCSTHDCDNMTGYCPDCIEGYSGADCKVCPPSRYGLNCTRECSENCYNQLCDYILGTCDTCLPGYGGSKCEEFMHAEAEIVKASMAVSICVVAVVSSLVITCYLTTKMKTGPEAAEEAKPKAKVQKKVVEQDEVEQDEVELEVEDEEVDEEEEDDDDDDDV